MGSGKDLGIQTLGKKVSEAAELYEKSQRLEGEGSCIRLPGDPAPTWVGPGLRRSRIARGAFAIPSEH